MKKFFLFVVLVFSFTFDANADETSNTICKIVKYTQDLGGPMITIVIIGAALLAIFGRMPWPALFALGAFTAVFFGAPAVIQKIKPDAMKCEGGIAKPAKRWNANVVTDVGITSLNQINGARKHYLPKFNQSEVA